MAADHERSEDRRSPRYLKHSTLSIGIPFSSSGRVGTTGFFFLEMTMYLHLDALKLRLLLDDQASIAAISFIRAQ